MTVTIFGVTNGTWVAKNDAMSSHKSAMGDAQMMLRLSDWYLYARKAAAASSLSGGLKKVVTFATILSSTYLLFDGEGERAVFVELYFRCAAMATVLLTESPANKFKISPRKPQSLAL